MDELRTVKPHAAADPIDSILSQMQGKTITMGWDVVCAMEVDRINDLLEQQYVANLNQGSTLPPINATVPVIENISVQFVNLTLGPPLIRFDPNLEPQELHLTINFISGLVNTVQASGSVTTLLGTQVISPGDEYSLTGVVPLSSVAGEVQANHDVVIDIANGTAFSANLGLQGGAATTLGQYFLGWLQSNVQNFKYKLGTLVYTPGAPVSPRRASSNLRPSSMPRIPTTRAGWCCSSRRPTTPRGAPRRHCRSPTSFRPATRPRSSCRVRRCSRTSSRTSSRTH